MKIFLFVSEIATLLGISKYSPQKTFTRLLEKYDSELIEAIKAETSLKIKENDDKIVANKIKEDNLKKELIEKKITSSQFAVEIKKVEKDNVEFKEVKEEKQNKIDIMTLSKKDFIIKKIGKETIDTIQNETNLKKKKEIIKNVTDDLTNKKEMKKEEIQFFEKEMKSIVNTEYGIQKEMTAIEQFEMQEKVKLDTQQEFFKILLTNVGDKRFYLGGKVDGLLEDEYVVEVKNRTRCFFNQLREYENVQIQMYMFILDYPRTKLVEKYNKKIRITDVQRDEKSIKEILDKTKLFCEIFGSFLNNEALRREYYNLKYEDQENFIYEHFYYKLEDMYNPQNENQDMECDIDMSC